MKLYELSETMTKFLEAVEAGEIPEEAIYDTLEAIDMAWEDKAESTAIVIKQLNAGVQDLKNEENNIAERRRKAEASARKLTEYLAYQMQATGRQKFETAKCSVSFRKSTSLQIDDEKGFKDWLYMYGLDDYLKYSEPTIDKTKVTTAIKAGTSFEGAFIKENQNIQIK